MEELWHSILKLIEPIVIPDWGALIGLLPVFIGALVVLWILSTVRRFATVGPARRGPRRVEPVAPPELHMPGPSWAPVLGAAGLFLLMYGFVVGGLLIWVGVAALVAALLYWLGEGLRDYDHVAGVGSTLPAVIHAGPPPGVHMPGPSFRPVLVSLGLALLVAGFVFGGLVLGVGVLFLVVSLLGWLRDARHEYVKAEDADRTGHLENIPAPAAPTRLVGVFAVLVVFAVLIQAGIFPPQTKPAAGTDASAKPSGPAVAADVAIVAKEIAFDRKSAEVAAGKPFSIAFRNDDPAAVLHDVDLRQTDGKTVISNQNTIPGGQSVVYQYDALQPGTYDFICSVHPIPAMTGTLTVK
jgi:plastocyanin